MQHIEWVSRSLDNLPIQEEKKKELIRFWAEFYDYLDMTNMSGELQNTNMSVGNTSRSVQYKEEVKDFCLKQKID